MGYFATDLALSMCYQYKSNQWIDQKISVQNADLIATVYVLACKCEQNITQYMWKVSHLPAKTAHKQSNLECFFCCELLISI